MDKFEIKDLLTKKNILGLVVVLVLLAAIPLTVNLVQQRQQVRSKAAGEPPIVFSGPNVSKDSNNQYVTTDPTVQVELRSPLGLPASE